MDWSNWLKHVFSTFGSSQTPGCCHTQSFLTVPISFIFIMLLFIDASAMRDEDMYLNCYNVTLNCCSETLTVTENMTRNQPLISQLQNTNFITFCNHLSWCFRVRVTHCNSWASTSITSSGTLVEFLGFIVGGLFIRYADLPGFGRPKSAFLWFYIRFNLFQYWQLQSGCGFL